MKEISVVSSNIRFANPADGPNDWPHRRPYWLQVINAASPDILGTQEGREGQLRDLAQGIPHLTMLESHRSWISERMYPCLFVNEKKFEVLDSGDIWLSETPYVAASKSFESVFPRLCVWARLKLRESNTVFTVVNTHLDHVQQETRIKQASVLVQEVKKIIQGPLILMGDFNESPRTMIKQSFLDELNLLDPWVEKGLQEESSHHNFQGQSTPGDRIDWILVQPQFEVIDIRLVKNSFEGGIYPSDHYPLWAILIPSCT